MKQPSKKIRFNAEDSARQVSECGLNKRVVIDLLFMNTFATHRHFCVVVSSASHPPPHRPARQPPRASHGAASPTTARYSHAPPCRSPHTHQKHRPPVSTDCRRA